MKTVEIILRMYSKFSASLKISRNDFVKITNGEETKEIKFKKAKPLIESGEWKIV